MSAMSRLGSMGRQDRLVAGLALGFIGPGAAWTLIVVGYATESLPEGPTRAAAATLAPVLATILVLSPVALFAVIGAVLRAWGLVGALAGCILAVPIVFALVPVIAPSIGEAEADSIGFGIPFEIVLFMLPAGLLGWAARVVGGAVAARA